MASKSQEFLADGTFVVGATVSMVRLTMVGGGGAGSWSNGFPGGSAGGSGGRCERWKVPVSPNASVAVSIGAGGTPTVNGVLSAGGSAGDGGNTNFGSFQVSGGKGGYWIDSGHPWGGIGGNASGGLYVANDLVLPEHYGTIVNATGASGLRNPAQFCNGSNGGGSGYETRHGGGTGGNIGGRQGTYNTGDGVGGGAGAGSTPWGQGPQGANASGFTQKDGNAPGSTAYGCGGSGSCAGGTTKGGAGKSGYCLVEWDE